MAILLTPNRSYPYPDYAETANFPLQIQNFATAVDTDVQAQYTAVAAAQNRIGVRCTGSAAQSIPTGGGGAAATYATEDYDNGNFFVIGSPDRFTIPVTGLYLLGFRATFVGFTTTPPAGGNVRNVFVEQNLVSAPLAGITQYGNSSGTVVSLTALISFTAGTIVRFILRQDTGSAQNTTTRRASISLVTT